MILLESLQRHLETLRIIVEHPRLVAETRDLRRRVEQLSSELTALGETQHIFEGTTVTLADLHQRVRRCYDAAIQAAATDRFDEYRRELDHRHASSVRNEALDVLNTVLTTLRAPEPRYFPSDVVDSGLLANIEALLDAEVSGDTERQRTHSP